MIDTRTDVLRKKNSDNYKRVLEAESGHFPSQEYFSCSQLQFFLYIVVCASMFLGDIIAWEIGTENMYLSID